MLDYQDFWRLSKKLLKEAEKEEIFKILCPRSFFQFNSQSLISYLSGFGTEIHSTRTSASLTSIVSSMIAAISFSERNSHQETILSITSMSFYSLGSITKESRKYCNLGIICLSMSSYHCAGGITFLHGLSLSSMEVSVTYHFDSSWEYFAITKRNVSLKVSNGEGRTVIQGSNQVSTSGSTFCFAEGFHFLTASRSLGRTKVIKRSFITPSGRMRAYSSMQSMVLILFLRSVGLKSLMRWLLSRGMKEWFITNSTYLRMNLSCYSFKAVSYLKRFLSLLSILFASSLRL